MQEIPLWHYRSIALQTGSSQFKGEDYCELGLKKRINLHGLSQAALKAFQTLRKIRKPTTFFAHVVYRDKERIMCLSGAKCMVQEILTFTFPVSRLNCLVGRHLQRRGLKCEQNKHAAQTTLLMLPEIQSRPMKAPHHTRDPLLGYRMIEKVEAKGCYFQT